MRTTLRRIAGHTFSVLALLALGNHATFAVGGDDVNTSTEVNAATRACQAKIAAARASHTNQAAAAMVACLDAIVKCDDQAGTALAYVDGGDGTITAPTRA